MCFQVSLCSHCMRRAKRKNSFCRLEHQRKHKYYWCIWWVYIPISRSLILKKYCRTLLAQLHTHFFLCPVSATVVCLEPLTFWRNSNRIYEHLFCYFLWQIPNMLVLSTTFFNTTINFFLRLCLHQPVIVLRRCVECCWMSNRKELLSHLQI